MFNNGGLNVLEPEEDKEDSVKKEDSNPTGESGTTGETTHKGNSDNDKADFSWKKNGFDMREHLTLKNNALEASAFEENKDKKQPKKRINIKQTIPLDLFKLRKKVQEVYDEEDDEEYTYIPRPTIQMPEERDDNRLMKGLTDNEKLMLLQKETLSTIKSLQDAGKMEALHVAHNLAKETGLKGLSEKTVATAMQTAVFKPKEMQEKVVQKEVSGRLGMKGKIQDGKIIQAARGIKKVENLGGQKATKNLDMKDVIKAGEDKLDEIKLAELILKKSGQNVQRRKAKVKKSKENMDLKYLQDDKKKYAQKEKSDAPKFRGSQSEFSR